MIESERRHDFVWYACGVVDGGRTYLSRTGNDYEELAVVIPRPDRPRPAVPE